MKNIEEKKHHKVAPIIQAIFNLGKNKKNESKR